MNFRIARLSLIFAFGVLCLTPLASVGQGDLSAKLAEIEKIVNAKREELHIPGAALVIVKDDKVIFMKGMGLRDVERSLPVTQNTLFAIGSSTKAFTAMTVLMSAEAGKLSLSDSPKKYLPYFKLRDPEADSKITISDLLCHRCGLDRTDMGWYFAGDRLSAKDLIQLAGLAKPTAKFGEKFQYQNVMFLTAGEIVAKVQQKPWGRFLMERIIKPLGMKETVLRVRDMQRSPDFSLGYVYEAGEKKFISLPTRDIQNVAPAGAINSNVKDMAQWLRLMLNDGVFEGKRFLSEANFKELTVQRITAFGDTGYGYGWFLRNWKGHRVVEHGGNIDGFNAQVALMPDQKLGFCLLTNVSASPLGTLTMDAVWSNLVDAPKEMPSSNAQTADLTPPVGTVNETGTYHLTEANVDIVVTSKEGKLYVQVTGQPVIALESVGGHRYKASPPAPPNVTVAFRTSQANPKETEMVLDQGGMKFTLKQKASGGLKKTDMTAEALMQKAIEALGGEASLRKRHATQLKFTLEMENQGITGEGTDINRAPNAAVERVTFKALGKPVGWARDYFDGAQGGEESSFSPSRMKSGNELIDAKIAEDFYAELNWKTLFKSVTVKGMDTLDGEEVYVVEKTPAKGSPITDYVSTKSFLLLKRSGPGSESVRFKNYKPVQGIQIPFTRETEQPGQGKLVITVKEAKFNVHIPDSAFRPAAPSVARSTPFSRLYLYD